MIYNILDTMIRRFLCDGPIAGGMLVDEAINKIADIWTSRTAESRRGVDYWNDVARFVYKLANRAGCSRTRLALRMNGVLAYCELWEDFRDLHYAVILLRDHLKNADRCMLEEMIDRIQNHLDPLFAPREVLECLLKRHGHSIQAVIHVVRQAKPEMRHAKLFKKVKDRFPTIGYEFAIENMARFDYRIADAMQYFSERRCDRFRQIAAVQDRVGASNGPPRVDPREAGALLDQMRGDVNRVAAHLLTLPKYSHGKLYFELALMLDKGYMYPEPQLTLALEECNYRVFITRLFLDDAPPWPFARPHALPILGIEARFPEVCPHVPPPPNLGWDCLR